MSDQDKVFKLTKPIENINGGKISEITIKEPTAADVIDFGLPVTPDGQIDMKNAFNIMERRTGVQLPILKQMSAKDALNSISLLVEYFAEGDEDTTKK